ncbi:acyltransferase family protein [Ruania alba]|uniref:Peptidoglycan/LPS O-acetylase OafA/YrhL, contains acyltransferase and SGNH-hydrolase domains n=1 Tax=Ruania alba TaxID=648782 RepID=A0A1H5NB03_9MICO|nr:acyltransferase family protein [Ruania alba]SEE98753.1 Peptidoglycan/LPS O-acetylase OafA/YrhL, contains acyltransferase and SGNH-hydrolase domains [Ruania alba]
MPSHSADTERPRTRPSRRAEIEGLRAVAAVLVALYHIFVGRVSGAVDVFFVVAGFLITTSLLHQVHASGRVQIGTYLSRLARRLLPTALVVLVVVLASMPWWLPSTRLRATFSEVAASALYLENWALAAKAVDYLARDQAPSPVQHFWAMSVQGQFYLLWLGLFLLVLCWGAASLRRHLTIAIVGLFAGSFTFSVLLTQANQPLAYFHTATRMWEFAAGALVALAPAALTHLRAPVRAAGAWLGLLMIVSTGLVWPVSTSFPGWVAAWPVAGAVLILWCAYPSGQAPRWSAEHLLGSRPLTWLGGYSYGLYLWHWPLLTIVLARSGSTEVGLLPGLGIIAAALALSVLTTRLVEAPIRSRTIRMPWRAIAVGLAAVLTVATTAGMLSWRAQDEPLPVSAGPQAHPGAAVLLPDGPLAPEDDGASVYPSPAAATQDKAAVYEDECHQNQESAEPLACEYADPDGAITVYLIGSSHAAHWFPAMEQVAISSGWRLVSITKSSCVFSTQPDGPTEISGTALSSCERWNRNVMDLIEADPPDLVVTTGTHGNADRGRTVPPGYLAHWETLSSWGVPVVAIRDTPWWPSARPDCLALHGTGSSACDALREDLIAPVDPTAQVTLPPTVSFVDLNDYVCPDRWCPAVIGNVLVYYDSHHLTATYSRSLAPMLAASLTEAGFAASAD